MRRREKFTTYKVKTDNGGTVTVLCPLGAKCQYATDKNEPTPGFVCPSCKRRVCYCYGCSSCCGDICDGCWAQIHYRGRKCTGTKAADKYSSEIGLQECSNA